MTCIDSLKSPTIIGAIMVVIVW